MPKGAKDAKRRGKKKKSEKKKGQHTTAVKLTVIFLLVILATLAVLVALSRPSEDRIAHGVSFGPVKLAGLTGEQARQKMNDYLTDYRLNFITRDGLQSIGPFVGPEQSIVFDTDNAIEQALDIGRIGNPPHAYLQGLKSLVFGTRLRFPLEFDQEGVTATIEQLLDEDIQSPQDARFQITVRSDDSYDIALLPESSGRDFDRPQAVAQSRDRLSRLSDEPIELTVELRDPELTETDLEPLLPEVRSAMQRTPRNVSARSLSWTISRSHLADWLTPEKNGRQTVLTLDRERVEKHLESYASSMTVEPIDAVFVIEDGKVTEFSPSVDGETLDIEASYDILKEEFLSSTTLDAGVIELPVAVAKPEVTTEESNSYGIKEMIGTGATNFAGSPANRRHNIALGASTLHGLLIPPGEEFSLIGALGEIDGAHGYLPELVIKDNKTIPEYGGGLCQIGTTTFRTVLDTGLPVTQRRNHSYRVSYYERDGEGNYIGPGKDATIYDPWPDFRFLNDTGHHILIRADIQGNRIDFDFWGTGDGRQAEQTDSVILGTTAPPPKKVILTTDLPVGQERCTEHAHAGASAMFTYTVTYPDGEVKEEDFTSWYKPWQEVCLLGATPEDVAASQEQPIVDPSANPVETDPTEEPLVPPTGTQPEG